MTKGQRDLKKINNPTIFGIRNANQLIVSKSPILANKQSKLYIINDGTNLLYWSYCYEHRVFFIYHLNSMEIGYDAVYSCSPSSRHTSFYFIKNLWIDIHKC